MRLPFSLFSSSSLLCRVSVLGGLVIALGAACPKKTTNTVEGPQPVNTALEKPTAQNLPEVRIQPPSGTQHLAIAYTASVQGYVTPCGCTADPLGGVARLSALLDELRSAYQGRVLFLDAGDLLFEKLDDHLPADRCQAEARIDLLLSTYARKGLAATVLGPLDDVRGAAFRDERMAKYGITTVGVPDAGRRLVANAVHQAGMLRSVGDIKVGITGVSLRSADAPLVSFQAALAQEAKRLRGAGAAVVIVLAQASRPVARQLAANLDDVDVVILGREPGEQPSPPERLGERGPLLVAAGMQAQHLGILEFHLDGRETGQTLQVDDRVAAAERRAHLLDVRMEQYEKQIADIEAGPRRQFLEKRLAKVRAERSDVLASAAQLPPPGGPYVRVQAIPLPRGVAEETHAARELAAYEGSIPALVASCEAGISCAEPAAGAAIFVGATSCQGCHAKAFDFWQSQHVISEGKDKEGNVVPRTLSHANAWQTLVEQGKDKDRSCIGCHSVGFNQVGGYCRSSEVGERKGVQCESCHGPGSLHVQSGGDPQQIRKEVPESTCRQCHQVPHIPTTESFVYEDKLKWILGPGHGEERWQMLGPATR